MDYKTKYTTNQDIRTYMFDHGVSQRMLAEHMDTNVWRINTMLQKELSDSQKEDLLHRIDAIVADRHDPVTEEPAADDTEEQTDDEAADVSCTTKFQIGDRVKIPSKNLCIGTVCDIWHSLLHNKMMYAVEVDGGSRGLYAENQLEPAPVPVTYRFETHIDGNVAVTTMIAVQGDKEYVYARGHAHIIHDGEVGLAQAISYSARRMFESLDAKQKNKIYFK